MSMKITLNYFWFPLWALLVFHGTSIIQNEWQKKSIHDHGELIEVKIEALNCPQQTMSFHFGGQRFQKKIDARTCVLYNEGQMIKLKHSQQHADVFLFVNERSPNLFTLGSLEIVLGIIGLLASWPFTPVRSTRNKNFRSIS